jgi:tetratricopeptide (TPR) repeat protein
MSLEDVVKRFLNDPSIDEIAKNDIRALTTSHLATGMKLQQQGLILEAIQEFAKENNRPIHSDIDKEIIQNSYWHIGVAYRKVGELENAKFAFEKARELLKLYGVGHGPHYDLAEIMIEDGKLDEAIAICQELLSEVPDGGVKLLLAKALELKKNSQG